MRLLPGSKCSMLASITLSVRIGAGGPRVGPAGLPVMVPFAIKTLAKFWNPFFALMRCPLSPPLNGRQTGGITAGCFFEAMPMALLNAEQERVTRTGTELGGSPLETK